VFLGICIKIYTKELQ